MSDNPNQPSVDRGNVLHARALTRLFRYWDGKRGARRMPSRRDLDPPFEIPDLLPFLFLLDVEAKPLRFRYRLVGTGIVAFSRRDLTGRYADETVLKENIDSVVAPYRLVVERRAPAGMRGLARWISGRESVALETLLLPLSSDGKSVDIILGGVQQLQDVASAEPPLELDRPSSGTRVFLNPIFPNGA